MRVCGCRVKLLSVLTVVALFWPIFVSYFATVTVLSLVLPHDTTRWIRERAMMVLRKSMWTVRRIASKSENE
jgi:hypothetical protein